MKKINDLKDITIKEKIALGIVAIILLAIATNIIASIGKRDNIIDYKKININDIILNSNEIKDRDVYWILNDITYTFLSSYNDEISVNEQKRKYSRKSYYAVLDNDYKKSINMSKYLEISRNMMEKFVVYTKEGIQIKSDNIINKVYLLDSNVYDDDMYLCELNTVTEGISSYIGIKIKEGNLYSIFYLE